MSLLSSAEPSAFERLPGAPGTRIVLVCDHASNRIPASLGDMGLAPEHLVDHIAWDIGAAEVARQLQARLGATAVLAGYSRLVVDLNRALDDPSAFPVISDGVLVGANLSLTPEERERRAQALHEPYHDAIAQAIDELSRGDDVPVFVGIHSFTPRYHRTRRPWHVGILWHRDPRLALPMLRALRAEPDVLVGDNEPYSGRHPADYSIDHHAEPVGLAYVGIEIRQDLIADKAGQARWSDIVGRALECALGDPSVYRRAPMELRGADRTGTERAPSGHAPMSRPPVGRVSSSVG